MLIPKMDAKIEKFYDLIELKSTVTLFSVVFKAKISFSPRILGTSKNFINLKLC